MDKMRVFDIPFLGKRILSVCARRQGGAQESATLRLYYRRRYHTTVGLYSYGGCFSPDFCTRGIVEIGKYTSIGPNVRYFGTNHPLNFASMSPYFYNRSFALDVKDFPWGKLSIGNDVWIGCNAVITAGCTSIGNGAVIGAGAIVTKNIEPYSVVAGNPAKKIKMRFDEAQITALEATKWFDLSPVELYRFYSLISDPIRFAESVAQYKREKGIHDD